jgi:hypothetical protein
VGRGLDKTVYWIVAAIINVALSFEVGAEGAGAHAVLSRNGQRFRVA